MLEQKHHNFGQPSINQPETLNPKPASILFTLLFVSPGVLWAAAHPAPSNPPRVSKNPSNAGKNSLHTHPFSEDSGPKSDVVLLKGLNLEPRDPKP